MKIRGGLDGLESLHKGLARITDPVRLAGAVAEAAEAVRGAAQANLRDELASGERLGGVGDAVTINHAPDGLSVRDWSTGTERGSEHVLMLHVWSRYEGKREAYEIADAVREVLDGAELSLGDHRLINLTHQFSDLKRDPDGETYHGVVRFRAVTEPLD